MSDGAAPVLWAKLLDQSKCIGCHACTTACKSENQVPLTVNRTYVKAVEVGEFPRARRFLQVTRCNQCEDAPCVAACPTSAMYRRPDGIVDFDKSACIGCQACIAACPYDAIFINPEDHSAEKCNFCAHRLDMGLEPACVVVCPVGAILVGDLNDPESLVARAVSEHPVQVRRPEKNTRPKVFYKGAHQATLDPLAARRPDGGLYMWSQQPAGPQEIGSGVSAAVNSSAEALLGYDVSHRAPWDWRVGLYTWTKSIATGAYLVAAMLVLIGALPSESVAWRIAVPVLCLVFLGLTGLILILDLKHPLRFWFLFVRPQWRSWLARGAFIITGFGLILVVDLGVGFAGPPGVLLIGLSCVLSILTAVYTAYLFGQARGRDLWQSPLLPPHLVVQAILAGSAALLPVVYLSDPSAVPVAAVVLAAGCALHLLFVLGELTVTHPTVHAQLAAHNLRTNPLFIVGVILVATGLLAPALWFAAAPLALCGLLLHEHAYIQGGQSVPLA